MVYNEKKTLAADPESTKDKLLSAQANKAQARKELVNMKKYFSNFILILRKKTLASQMNQLKPKKNALSL